jgi:hypothetical protein
VSVSWPRQITTAYRTICAGATKIDTPPAVWTPPRIQRESREDKSRHRQRCTCEDESTTPARLTQPEGQASRNTEHQEQAVLALRLRFRGRRLSQPGGHRLRIVPRGGITTITLRTCSRRCLTVFHEMFAGWLDAQS